MVLTGFSGVSLDLADLLWGYAGVCGGRIGGVNVEGVEGVKEARGGGDRSNGNIVYGALVVVCHVNFGFDVA